MVSESLSVNNVPLWNVEWAGWRFRELVSRVSKDRKEGGWLESWKGLAWHPAAWGGARGVLVGRIWQEGRVWYSVYVHTTETRNKKNLTHTTRTLRAGGGGGDSRVPFWIFTKCETSICKLYYLFGSLVPSLVNFVFTVPALACSLSA